MAYQARAELVSAVSNAGGIGILTSAIYDKKEDFHNEVRKTKSLTDKPFGVNLNLFPATRAMNNDEVIEVILEEGIRFVEASGGSPKPFWNSTRRRRRIIEKVPT